MRAALLLALLLALPLALPLPAGASTATVYPGAGDGTFYTWTPDGPAMICQNAAISINVIHSTGEQKSVAIHAAGVTLAPLEATCVVDVLTLSGVYEGIEGSPEEGYFFSDYVENCYVLIEIAPFGRLSDAWPAAPVHVRKICDSNTPAEKHYELWGTVIFVHDGL